MPPKYAPVHARSLKRFNVLDVMYKRDNFALKCVDNIAKE